MDIRLQRTSTYPKICIEIGFYERTTVAETSHEPHTPYLIKIVRALWVLDKCSCLYRSDKSVTCLYLYKSPNVKIWYDKLIIPVLGQVQVYSSLQMLLCVKFMKVIYNI